MKNKAKKSVSEQTREKTKGDVTEFKSYQNGIFRLVKGLTIACKKVASGRCVGRQAYHCNLLPLAGIQVMADLCYRILDRCA